jgi:hypothetical protein
MTILVYFKAIGSILWPFGLITTIGSILRPLEVFYGHLVYFTAIGSILWPFGIFCGILVYFPRFWYFAPRKIWQPCKTA